MNCPQCNHKKTHVVDSRFKVDETKRRRLCRSCGFRFNTYEILPFESLSTMTSSAMPAIKFPNESSTYSITNESIMKENLQKRTKNALSELGEKIFLDRYAMKDVKRETFAIGDTVIVCVNEKTGQREIGEIVEFR